MEGVSEDAILQEFLPTPGPVLGAEGDREGTRLLLRQRLNLTASKRSAAGAWW